MSSVQQVSHLIPLLLPLASPSAWLFTLSPPDCSRSLLPGSVSGLLITSHPQSQTVSEGDSLYLECNTQANPPAQYRWHHNMVPLEQEKSRLLQVSGLLIVTIHTLYTILYFTNKATHKTRKSSQTSAKQALGERRVDPFLMAIIFKENNCTR